MCVDFGLIEQIVQTPFCISIEFFNVLFRIFLLRVWSRLLNVHITLAMVGKLKKTRNICFQWSKNKTKTDSKLPDSLNSCSFCTQHQHRFPFWLTNNKTKCTNSIFTAQITANIVTGLKRQNANGSAICVRSTNRMTNFDFITANTNREGTFRIVYS